MKKIVFILMLLCSLQIHPKENKFSLLSLNSALLAITADVPIKGVVRVAEVGVLKNNAKRAERIADTLKRHKPDIVVLQEAFDTEVVKKKLVKPLKDVYPYHFTDKRSGRIGVKFIP